MLALPTIIVILGDCDAEDVKDFFVDPNLISIANRLLSKSPKTEEEEAEGEEHNRLLHHQEIFKNQQRIGNKPTLTNCSHKERKQSRKNERNYVVLKKGNFCNHSSQPRGFYGKTSGKGTDTSSFSFSI